MKPTEKVKAMLTEDFKKLMAKREELLKAAEEIRISIEQTRGALVGVEMVEKEMSAESEEVSE